MNNSTNNTNPNTNNNAQNNNTTKRKKINLNMNDYLKKQAMRKLDDNGFSSKLREAVEKNKNKNAKKALKNNIGNFASPLESAVVKSKLAAGGGEEYIDTVKNASNEMEGVAKVAAKIKIKGKLIKIGLIIGGIAFAVLFVITLITSIFKNADSQIYSNVNDGKIDPEQYPDNDLINPNVFVKYPGIYEKVEAAARKVGSQYKVDIDRYLILATLIAPLENENIVPVSDESCGETDCYYLKGESYTWTEFLKRWGDQAEYLAKAQILTYVNKSSDIKVTCGKDQTMEQYAQNDLEVNDFNFWKLFNPANWFKGFRDATGAELNAKYIYDVEAGESRIPTIYVLSKAQGIYYNDINADGERTFVKDPNSGGVYFWNLVNNGGFIHVYFGDYLNINENATDDQNYEQNLSTILDIANYIYSYYESIRKDCEGYLLIESTIETINMSQPGGGVYTLPLDQYIGGVVLAEIGYNDNIETIKAFATLARSYAISVVGLDGSGTIENSSNNQNYSWNYTPEKYPRIAQAVEETKGFVLTHYGQASVIRSSYDAFCPTTSEPINDFYYLPDGQNNIPISLESYRKKTGHEFTVKEKYLKCPCFQNESSRPNNVSFGGKKVRFATSPNNPPTEAAGSPRQTTDAECWTYTGSSRINSLTQATEYAWTYKATGGHGRGASQVGLSYYGMFGYEWEALIRMFYTDSTIKRLSSSLEEGECQNASYYKGETGSTGSTTIEACGATFESNGGNYTKRISGNPLNSPLTNALDSKGYSIECLNSCIEQRVSAAGIGTRYGTSEAAVALLECTMEMTGGFTYPYDHRGGYTPRNPDIAGQTGVNSRWGEYESWATGCGSSKCRLGLNCANFVRWSMCNGGRSDFCNSRRQDTFATGITGVNSDTEYFPGAVRLYLSGRSHFSVSPNVTIGDLSSSYQQKFSSLYSTSTALTSVDIDKVLSLIQPGDVLYSDVNGGSNHAMMIIGVEDSAIWIAENGRKTRMITYDDLKSGSKNYVVLLLDGYYES